MDPGDLTRFQALALRAAQEGGRVVREAWGAPGDAEEKAAGDYVTAVDRRAEEAIGSLLGSEAPDIPVVGEELGGRAGERFWLVDPVDGTTNLLHRIPVVGVSVALMEAGRPAAAAVHAPILGLSFSAARGQGAEGGGRALRVSDRAPEEAIVGTGFPFRDKARLPRYERVLLAALRRFEDLRRPGAASLDLAWVATGAYDGFFELGLSAWDVAAGGLLIEEAGGMVTGWDGGPGYLEGDIVAGNPSVHGALLQLAKESGEG